MKRYAITLFISILLCSFCSAQDSRKNKLRDYFDLIERTGFSGQILIAENGQTIANAALGRIAHSTSQKVTENTLFGIASMSKQFTAAAIGHLVQSKKLSFDSPLSAIFKNIPEDKLNITIHQLLTHTSGIPGGDLISDFEPLSKGELLKKIVTSELSFSPGEKWRYSNAGYNVLALIIEEVSGLSYEEYLTKYFFSPLKLDYTRIIGSGDWKGLSVAHAINGSYDAGDTKKWKYNMRTLGGGNIASTVSDLQKWNESLEQNTILKKRITDQLFTPHYQISGNEYYGYGWFVFKKSDGATRLIEHGGDYEKGFNGGFYRFQNPRLTILILSNKYEPAGAELWTRWAVYYPIRDIMFNKNVGFDKVQLRLDEITDISGSYADEVGSNKLVIEKCGTSFRLEISGGDLSDQFYAVHDTLRADLRRASQQTTALVDELLKDNFEAFKVALKERAKVWDVFAEEWENVVKVHGRVLHYEVLGSVANNYNDGVKCFVRFHHERGISAMSYGWMENGKGRLYGTSAMDNILLEMFIHLDANGKWRAYNLFEDSWETFEIQYTGSKIQVGNIILNKLE